MGCLFRLQTIEFSNNWFGGGIPNNPSCCSRLEWLNLIDNNLTGNIPAELGSLSRLGTLALSINKYHPSFHWKPLTSHLFPNSLYRNWNSILESLASAVPVVAFPHWSDQTMNVKMVTGVRVKANEEGIIESEEFKGCIKEVMGGEERGEKMRRNAKKWKELTREAVKEGGSSDLNLKAFVENIGGGNYSSRV
ncbi:hypothetical protein TEA_026651 [Camellia sinensis var. sinensis]|uniref:Uncharacterized protein n=1 Tax=Camellia sinensis var. sinensis TaxID=542762 RepID=A0A4S4ETW8_CAMSN|nr:hypothetical protein TEA_026651 [Camellia sinensis var. sinensis]